MGVLGSIVQILRPAVLDRRHDLAVRDLVAAQPVGDDDPRHVLQALEEFAEELLGGQRVSAWLDQDVEDVAVLVDGPPQVVTTAGDRQEHLVEVPLVAGSGLAAAQAGRVHGSELGAPLPDRLTITPRTSMSSSRKLSGNR